MKDYNGSSKTGFQVRFRNYKHIYGVSAWNPCLSVRPECPHGHDGGISRGGRGEQEPATMVWTTKTTTVRHGSVTGPVEQRDINGRLLR